MKAGEKRVISPVVDHSRGGFQWRPQVELQTGGSLAPEISWKYLEQLRVNVNVMFTHTHAHIHTHAYTSHRYVARVE